MPGDPATVWGAWPLAPGPLSTRPHARPCGSLQGWPQSCQLHLAFPQGKEGAGAPHGAARGSLAACPHPSGPQRAHREREERGHRGGLPWSELPRGQQTMGQGCFCRRAGQLCKPSQGPPGLYKGGRGSSRGPRALPGTGGAAGSQQESGAKTQTQGRRAHTLRYNLPSECLLYLASMESGWRIPGARGSGRSLPGLASLVWPEACRLGRGRAQK